MQHGLWIDCAPRTVMTEDYLRRFHALGFRTGAVMLESITQGFDPKWKLAELGKLGEMFRKLDIELVLTVWPEPNVNYVNELRTKLPALLKASGAAALESDAEGNYIRKKLVGYRTMNDASNAFVEVLREAALEQDVRSELTTFTMHEENGAKATLADDVDRVLGQAYSVRNRNGADGKPFSVPWDHQYGPGAMQRLTLGRSMQIPKKNGKPNVSCGLAAYDQEWPGHKGDEAMDVAYQAALKFNPKEIRWWSSKWVVGHLARPYAVRFFERLALAA